MSRTLDKVRGWAKRTFSASSLPPDFDRADIETWNAVSPYTMTSPERVFALRAAVQYVVNGRVPGDVVECGVWKGGSMMAVARTLLELGDTSRTLCLFDTFEGMPPPTDKDVRYTGRSAQDCLDDNAARDGKIWAVSSLEATRRAVLSVGYPNERIRFVEGRVEDTLPREAPESIALLRLDTDWYESTKHELEHLFPRLAPGGVLIIDDYGCWQGARRATDEYLAAHGITMLLQRIDYTGRMAVKPA